MKKVLAILLSLSLILSLSAAACAAGSDATVKALDASLSQVFPGAYTITEVGRLVIVNAWGDGITSDLAAARLGNSDCLDGWSTMISNLESAIVTIQSIFDKDGGSRVVIFNVVSENDHLTPYLSLAEGTVIYDTLDAQPVSSAPATKTEPAQSAAPSGGLTVAQDNAIRSAQSYLSWGSFSRSGLIDQLEYEGFSTEDATFAVDSLNVDWNEQAVKSAESYLSWGSFSRSGLIDQLEYEGFTHEQAVYGVEKAGY